MSDHDHTHNRTNAATTTREDDLRVEHHPDHGAVAVSPKLKTSAAAVFSLVFGLSSLLSALAVLLSPLAVVFGLIGLVLGIVGLKMAKQIHVTGKGVAIGGLVMSILGLLLGIGIIAGAATFLTDEANLQRIEDRLQDLRDEVPTELPQDLTE